MNRPTSDRSEIRAFFDQWNIYRLVLEGNHMFHREIHGALRDSLGLRRNPFSILDLGCGDASYIAKTIQGLPASTYVGVDLSAVALNEAEESFGASSVGRRFVQADFGEYVGREDTAAVDVILSGFALHHYPDRQKSIFFEACGKKLKAQGSLYVYDVFRRGHETRDQYMHVYLEALERTWTSLSSEQQALTREHILSSDHPVSYETLASFADSAGFVASGANPLYADPLGFHCLCHFERR